MLHKKNCSLISRTTRNGVLRREVERPLHDLAHRSRLRHPRGRHQQPEEVGGKVWHGLGPTDHHPEGHRHVQRSKLSASSDMPLLHQRMPYISPNVVHTKEE